MSNVHTLLHLNKLCNGFRGQGFVANWVNLFVEQHFV